MKFITKVIKELVIAGRTVSITVITRSRAITGFHYFRFLPKNLTLQPGLVWAKQGEKLPMTGFYKRLMLSGIAVFMLLPWTASAQQNQENQQDDRPPQARRQQQQQRRLNMLSQKLNLSSQQKQQWQQINQEATRRVWAARKDDSLNEQQMQAQLREIHKQHDQDILAILTPEQQDTLKEFREEQKQRQQDKTSDSNSSGGPSTQNNDNGKQNDDDLFAGMVSDDPPSPQPLQNKKAGRK